MRVVAFLRSYGDLYAASAMFGMYGALSGLAQQRAPAVIAILGVIFVWGVASCVAMWTVVDARARRCIPCFDFGSFLFFTWIVSVPCYLIATRGWRGVLIIFSAMLTTMVVAIGFVLVLVFAGFAP